MLSSAAKQFIIREASKISLQISPTVDLTIPCVDDLVEYLAHFLEFQMNHPSVAGLGSKFSTAIESVAKHDIKLAQVVTTLEQLSTAFEPFLKKTGLIKFSGDHQRIDGDHNFVGIAASTLGKLLEGELARRRDPVTRNLPDVMVPLVSFSYTPTTPEQHVYFRARQIRNLIHEAADWTSATAHESLQIVLAAYCLTLSENLALRAQVDPLFAYLRTVSQQCERRITVYVENIGNEKRYSDGWVFEELLAVEWNDNVPDDDSANRATVQPLTDTISNIANMRDRFWLVGEPGAGKSTSLNQIVKNRADESLALGRIASPVPVCLPASYWEESGSLKDLLAEQLTISDLRLTKLLTDGDLLLIIDGFNEIDRRKQQSLLTALDRFKNKYPNLPFIVATRKHALPDSVSESIVEILPFSNGDIHQYLRKVLPTEAEAELLYRLLLGDGSSMLRFARNPLFLKMIARVSQTGKLPANKGELFGLFINGILSREKARLSHPMALYEHGLSEIAFAMRETTIAKLTPERTIQILHQLIRSTNAGASIHFLYDELISTHIIAVDSQRSIIFAHELILEYFASIALQRRLDSGQVGIRDFAVRPEWHESIRILVSLIDNPDDAIIELASMSLILAARCANCRNPISKDVERAIVELAESAIQNRKKHKRIATNAITALLELGTAASLRAAVKAPLSKHISFKDAIWNCERPEEAGIQLLRFGSTGRERVLACLRAFDRHCVSTQFLDSKEVANAQRILLRKPFDIRHLQVIESIGIAPQARSDVEHAVADLLARSPLNTKTILFCVRLTAKEGFSSVTADQIRSWIGPINLLDGERAYLALSLCRSFRSDVGVGDLARECVKQCLGNGEILLGCEFVRLFDLFHEISPVDILKIAQECVSSGKFGRLSQLIRTFPDIDLREFARQALEKTSANGHWEGFVSLAELTALDDGSLAEGCIKMLINRAAKQNVRARFIKKLIDRFSLHARLADVWYVRSFNMDRGYGFARNCVTGDVAFFHASIVSKTWSRESLDLRGKLFEGYAEESKTIPGKLKIARCKMLSGPWA